MKAFNLPVGVSDMAGVRQVEQRFGLAGFARLIKLLELVAEVGTPARPVAVVAWGDFMIALDCNHDEAAEFLAFCEQVRLLDRGQVEGRLSVVLLGEFGALLKAPEQAAPPAPAYTGPVLFTTESQWREWFATEWSCPARILADPKSHMLFRRWCATNVTLDEAEAAVERAKHIGQAPLPAVLHEHLKQVRAAKIDSATKDRG